MSPSEKAAELYDKFLYTRPNNLSEFEARQVTLVCVNEIIKQWEYTDTYLAYFRRELNPNLKYWYEVKQEVLKL